MGTHRFALVVALLAACGDDSGSARVDAGDGGGDGDGGLFGTIPCDYTETMDPMNDVPNNAEASGVTFSGDRIVLCGKFDTGHHGMGTTGPVPDLVDADGIEFAIASPGQVIVHVIGDSNFTNTDRTSVYLGKKGVNAIFGFGVVEGDHGTFTFNVIQAGNYYAAVYTLDNVATPVAIGYKVLVSADTSRCAAKTGTADHAEGTDGGANDVVDYDFASNNQSSLSASPTDQPEATGITAAAGSSYLITANSENVDPGDDYMDRDTFAFMTGPTTTQMTVRLNWASTNTDFDYRVYPPVPVNYPESIVGGVDNSNTEFEYETFAVRPSTPYWLWVAAEDGATVPATYSATLCGETFTP